jgi:ABC-type lipoprotein export system ATPase subunit
LADEPTGALDAASTTNVAEVLRSVGQGGDVQVVVATHDPLVAGISDEGWVLTAGALVRR